MFSGIVEEYAEVVRIVKEQENLHLTLKCSFVDELKIVVLDNPSLYLKLLEIKAMGE